MSGKHHKNPWWRRVGRRPQEQKPRPLMAEMVDGATGLAHWVTSEAFEQGLRDGKGHFEVVCGRRIAVASMVAPPERSCWPCREARMC